MTYTVVHAGTGLTGREALRGLIDDPDIELAGLLVSSPDKVGEDAGSICGRGDTGVLAHGDFDAVLRQRPDCVAYCRTAVGREEDAYSEIAQLLRHGINVVTISTIPMVYPQSAPQRWRSLLESACQEGGSTFYASGCEPGLISLNLPVAILAGAGQVDSYRMDEYAVGLDLVYPIWDVLHESMGFGKPDGHVPARIASGKVRHDWEAVVHYIADALGLELDDIDLEWETLLAPHDLSTALAVIPAGHHMRASVEAGRCGRRRPGGGRPVLRHGIDHAVARFVARARRLAPGWCTASRGGPACACRWPSRTGPASVPIPLWCSPPRRS